MAVIELKGTVRIKSKSAAAWSAANPVLAADEPGRENDTGRLKIGNGTARWNALPYLIDPTTAAIQPLTPSLSWKVSEGHLYVSPNTSLDNPILQDCYIGILRYKNARRRVNRSGGYRASVKGYKVVQDDHTHPLEVPWTKVLITPIKVDVATLYAGNGWMPVISVEALFNRFVEKVADSKCANNRRFYIHRGQNIARNTFGPGYDGKIRQKATVYSGVVLFRYNPKNTNVRYEGARSYFKICASNHEQYINIVPMS